MTSAQARTYRVGTLVYTSGGLILLFFWLLWGDFAWSLKERSAPAVVQLMLKQYRASDLITGLLLGSLPGVLSIFIVPIFSHLSDQHRGCWGRRIPFLFAPSLPIVASLVALGFSPKLAVWGHEYLGVYSPGVNSMTLILIGALWTIFEFSSISANAVFGALINDVVPTVFLGRFYGLFRVFSLIAGMLFNFSVLGHVEAHFNWIFWGLAVVYGVGFVSMCFMVREGEYPLPEKNTVRLGFFKNFRNAIWHYLKECFGNNYYPWFFAASALMWAAVAPPTLYGVYFAQSIQMDMGSYGKCLALTYLISLGLAYPLGVLSDRFHPLRVCFVTQLAFFGITLWGGIFINNQWTFALALVLQGVSAGSWMTAASSLSMRLLPKAKYAQYASAASLIVSLCSITVTPLVGVALDRSGHNYHYIFLTAAALSAISTVLIVVVYNKFRSCGGPDYYVAPE